MKKIWYAIFVLTLGLLGGTWYLYTHPPQEDLFDALPITEIIEDGPLPSPELTPQPVWQVTLFVGDDVNGALKRYVREIDATQGLPQKIRQTIKFLIQPTPELRNPVIPDQTELLGVFFTENGIAYLNFNRHLQDRHVGGLSAELVTLASIVNTTLFNFKEIRQVQILIEGTEIETLAGHVDCRKPFSKMLLSSS
ncbi:hypothetical protein U27_01752 [Candidatus Vecturithrix granuli]|uniref:GerMN domain-containing protein n=1 Tax=Vecturithrix granuli TaxID=1499967 RepID=A0A0S6W9Q2_VECG1|nr:hypothetical protein U27_01752 [Candidatus Vecturithrix granuli]